MNEMKSTEGKIYTFQNNKLKLFQKRETSINLVGINIPNKDIEIFIVFLLQTDENKKNKALDSRYLDSLLGNIHSVLLLKKNYHTDERPCIMNMEFRISPLAS